MAQIKKLNSIPPSMRMAYGNVLKHDNPLVASWASSVESTLGEQTSGNNVILNIIMQLLCMLFADKPAKKKRSRK